MIDALHIASSALQANQNWLTGISHNIANMQTPGFKKTQTQFTDMVHRPVSVLATDANSANASEGAGTRLLPAYTVFSDGPLRATNNPLDLAIQGNGFIEVSLPSGDFAYTRMVALHTDSDGRLATRTGLILNSDIRIPPDVEAVEIDHLGHVRGKVANSAEILDLGELMLAHFNAPESLRSIGDGLYQVTASSGDPQISHAAENGAGQFQQGYLEMANVDMVEEMTGMVLAQRAYQLNARVLQASDQILETINNLRR